MIWALVQHGSKDILNNRASRWMVEWMQNTSCLPIHSTRNMYQQPSSLVPGAAPLHFQKLSILLFPISSHFLKLLLNCIVSLWDSSTTFRERYLSSKGFVFLTQIVGFDLVCIWINMIKSCIENLFALLGWREGSATAEMRVVGEEMRRPPLLVVELLGSLVRVSTTDRRQGASTIVQNCLKLSNADSMEPRCAWDSKLRKAGLRSGSVENWDFSTEGNDLYLSTNGPASCYHSFSNRHLSARLYKKKADKSPIPKYAYEGHLAPVTLLTLLQKWPRQITICRTHVRYRTKMGSDLYLELAGIHLYLRCPSCWQIVNVTCIFDLVRKMYPENNLWTALEKTPKVWKSLNEMLKILHHLPIILVKYCIIASAILSMDCWKGKSSLLTHCFQITNARSWFRLCAAIRHQVVL